MVLVSHALTLLPEDSRDDYDGDEEEEGGGGGGMVAEWAVK